MRAVYAAMTIALLVPSMALAQGPVYQLDLLGQHPYKYYPPAGHASQNPGSPKWFVPGYGYKIPGFGFPPQIVPTTQYAPQRDRQWRGSFARSQPMYWERGQTPWYFPGQAQQESFPLNSLAW